MKKWLLGIGAISAVAIPIATVISCSTDDDSYESSYRGSHSTGSYHYSRPVYVGPRGGTYTISSGGNREYFGHNSRYR